MNRRSLRVLVVAGDRTLLRHLSKFLGVFGYQVLEAADVEQAWAALDRQRPEFLIVDDNLPDAMELCRESAADESLSYIYTLLLTQTCGPGEVTDAIESGVDDFLAKPVVYGELLARLRAGARLREFERRWREQLGFDAVTGLPNRRSFMELLVRLTEQSAGARLATTCALVDIDFFGRVPISRGVRTADELRARVAQMLVESLPEHAVAAVFGEDRLAVLLPDHTAVESQSWAESLRAAVAEEEFGGAESPLPTTVSIGLADCEGGGPAMLEVVSQAEQALRLAKTSGRNCVVRQGEFAEEEAAWAELATPGRLFEHTVARDVMTPCTVTLHTDDPVERAAVVLRQTRLFAVPVVDDQGALLGVVTQETDWSRLSSSWRGKRSVREVMNAHPATENEYTSFAALVESISSDANSVIVIVDEGRPTGLITRDNLASLSEPLHTESFSPEKAESLRPTEYLLVDEYSTAAADD
ncbi:MAG: diguanylate cyclase [Pirellulaceae bacterium]